MSSPLIRVSACFVAIAAMEMPTSLPAQNTLIPLSTRRAMVFDHAGKYLYVTTTDGHVKRYNLSTRQVDGSYNLGGSPNGTDVAPDDSFLLVTESNTNGSQGIVHKINLKTGLITGISYPLTFNEAGSWDVAIASNGLALFTSFVHGSGQVPLRQISLATNAVTTRNVPTSQQLNGTVTAGTRIHRSVDGSRLYFLEADTSGGPVFTYGAASNTFGRGASTNTFLDFAGAAVNRKGTLLATQTYNRPASLDTAPGLHFVHGLPNFYGAAAFDAVTDTLYLVNNDAGQIIAYNTNTFGERFRLTVGESVGLGVTQFGIGDMVASQDGRYLALATPSGIRLFTVPNPLPSPTPTPAMTPTLTTRRDMVFDHASKFLYFTTSTGWIERYNVATRALDIVANLGGSLWGLDIAADDSFLLIAQDYHGLAEGTFHKLSLGSPALTNINYRLAFREAGAWDVAICSNGRAIITTQFDGDGSVPLRQIDLATNAVTVRKDAPNAFGGHEINQNTVIHRNANRTRLYFLGPNSSAGPIFTYDSATDSFGPAALTNTSLDNASAAVNRQGTLLGTRIGFGASLDTAPGFHYVRSFSQIDSGVVFDPLRDIFYGVDSSTSQVIAYGTNAFTEKFRFDIGGAVSPGAAPFDTGTLVASDNGRYLALEVPSGIQLLAIPSSPESPPAPVFADPRAMVFNHAGNHLYFTTGSGLIWPYNLVTQGFETPYNVGGSPIGADITANDSFLLIADGLVGLTQGAFRKLNLVTGSVTSINYNLEFEEAGAWDVAIASNGLAFVTTQFAGSGSTPLREINLSTNALSVRTDAPGSDFNGEVRGDTRIYRSVDGTRLYFLESNSSDGPAFTYSATTNSFGQSTTLAPPGSYTFLEGASAAVSRNGALLGTRLENSSSAFLDNAANYALVRRFAGLDSGVAFDATKNLFYGVNSSADQIVAYNTDTFGEQFRIPIGENVRAGSSPFGRGTLVASPDGRYLALMTATAIRIYVTSGH